MAKSRNRINGEGGWVDAGKLTTTSGSTHAWTGIPAWATELSIVFDGVSVSGTDYLRVRIGDSGGVESTGYGGSNFRGTNGNPSINTGDPTSFIMMGNNAVVYNEATMTISKVSGEDTWVAAYAGGSYISGQSTHGGGSKTLSGTLDRVSLETQSANTFDAGSATLYYR